MTSPTEQVAKAIALRADLKTHGLEHAVRIMSVPARGEARRLIRHALQCLIDSLEVDQESAEMPGSLKRGSTALREALEEREANGESSD